MRNLLLALAAAGGIGLAVSASPASAGVFTGLQTPAVESNTLQARCHHHRWSSRWHCYRRHRHWQAQPFYFQPYHHQHRWHHRRHRHHWHW